MKSLVKYIPENLQLTPRWEEISQLIMHKDMSFDAEYVIRLKRTDARSDDAQEIEFDLKEVVLPPNVVHEKTISLASRFDFVAAIVLVTDALMQKSGNAKSRGSHVRLAICILIKFFEFIWLRDKFHISDLTSEDFDEFAKAFAKGGWAEALKIEDRLKSAISANPELVNELVRRKGKSNLHINRNGLKRLVGSNLHSNDINDYFRKLVVESLNGAVLESTSFSKKKPRPMGVSTISHVLAILNNLFDLPNSFGINYVPYPDSRRLASHLGVPPTVTKNMGVREATAVVGHAYRWLYEYGDDIVALIAGACAQVVEAHKKKRKMKGLNLDRWLASSTIARDLEHKIGVKIIGVDSPRNRKHGVLTLRDVLLLFFTACFKLVAMMNARRKDEIIHPKYGLHYGFTKVIDEELAIFQGNFYLEKTLKDYLEFYVNRTTRDVALYLEKIQDCFEEVNVELGRPSQSEQLWSERSLFSYQRFSKAHGISETINSYLYDPTDPQNAGYKFHRLAFEGESLITPHPHMFRRMYSLIFMYQHEIPSMLALRQQLDHRSLKSTQVYLNDPITRIERESIGRKLGVSAQKRAEIFALHLRGVQEEIDLIRDEKLIEIILSIIEGQPTSGGYPKFIKKFYARISKKLDFSQLKNEAAAKEVARIVSEKGHSPNPSREGTCMAGGLRRSSASRCRDDDGVLRKENANVTLCGKCAFGFLNEAYVNNLEEDLTLSQRHLQSGHLQGLEEKRTVIDIANLKSMIAYHRDRLDQSRPLS